MWFLLFGVSGHYLGEKRKEVKQHLYHDMQAIGEKTRIVILLEGPGYSSDRVSSVMAFPIYLPVA